MTRERGWSPPAPHARGIERGTCGTQVRCWALQAVGMRSGAFLAERLIGANAASLALSEGIAVQVVGPEHFCAPLHPYTDTAAPIHAADGEMLAVLGIVTREEDGSPHTVGIVMATARAIEN